MAASSDGLPGRACAVVDVGKTHVRLIVIDARGEVLAERRRANASVHTPQGYLALDTATTEAWLCDALASLGTLRAALRRIIVTAHGAAFAALRGDALALPVPDYEFEGFDPNRAGWVEQLDPFQATLSPRLPLGLNAATQLDWLSTKLPDEFEAVDTLLPYPQYWAWWLSGVRACEQSSLGCHTQLWLPREHRYAELARRRGWARRFAPLRPAWVVLGAVRPSLAQRLGLPADLQVHCGAHDSNACLARHLKAGGGMSLVSTGTWVVVMAPAAGDLAWAADQELLANVSVRGDLVPTARFMGGRVLRALCAGADPVLADSATLVDLLGRGVMALPAFEAGRPRFDQAGSVQADDPRIDLRVLTAPERATVAALYCADVTAHLLAALRTEAAAVVAEGPLAANAVYMQALAALLPPGALHASTDTLEGTARGAWMLAHWQADFDARLRRVAPDAAATALRRHHTRWRERVGAMVRN